MSQENIKSFFELSSCREYGQTVGQIPWTAMDQYTKSNGFSDDEVLVDDFFSVMRALDNVWIEDYMERLKRERKKHTKGT